jgi:hypothetical protein
VRAHDVVTVRCGVAFSIATVGKGRHGLSFTRRPRRFLTTYWL